VTKVSVDQPVLEPGDDVTLLTYGASGTKPASATFVVADYFRAEMSEYDSSFVYVDIRDLQRIRGMGDHPSALQVKLKDDVSGDSERVRTEIVPALQELLPRPESRVHSWEQLQGPLLAAIDIERGILNILLFLIVGVAGFGVLAIFSMIVSEKYRDIGILKSLGASNRGVMSIFLGYGLLLGVIGCGLGTLAGLWITHHVNEIEGWVTYLSGKPVFDRSVYYFDKIPVNVEPASVVYVNLGATAIAVLFSVLPALRAARLQPVRALRFE
jgi:lipoprotein-releasing system permease protein